jgi:hypothetical protein
MTLIELLQERAYTAAQLKAHPLTAEMAKDFDQLHAIWLQVMEQEIALAEAVVTTEARARFVDGQLDQLLGLILKTVLERVDGDRGAPLYVRLVGKQKPSEVKRPVLGEQLELMRSWVTPLRELADPELQAHAETLAECVAQADEALAAQQAAEQQLTEFSERGDRRAFVERMSTLRRATFNRLTTLPRRHPDAGLAPDFAELFFQTSERARTPTLAGIEANIRRLEAQLEKQRAVLQKLTAKRSASEQARIEAERQLIQAELDVLEREHSDRQKRIDTLRAQLPK